MTGNRTTELLPCPFCGGEAKVIQADHPSYTPHSEGWYVICKCGATLGYRGTDELYMTYGDFASKLGAIAAWNTRATHVTLTAEQVRKVLLYHLPHREYYSVEQTDAWQAIADELNAELGSGTCELYGTRSSTCYEYKLSCGHIVISVDNEPPRYCKECGRKVER